MKQQMGLKAQMSDTFRHDNIEAQPNTMNMPKLMVDGAMAMIVPRIEGSL